MKIISTRLSLQVQKYIASALHLLFLAVMFAGVSLMYLNDNYGVGITKIQNVPYEETRQFNEQFSRDLNDIFHFMEYNSVFATNGSVDITKPMLQMIFGPNEVQTFSLGDIIEHLQSLGYSLDDNFECRGTPDPALSAKSPEGYIEWSASAPKEVHTTVRMDSRRASLETISLEIMEALKHYYSTYNRLMVNQGNLRFKIEYSESASADGRETLYTNDSDISPDNMTDYGKYAYLQGDSVFYDTNFKTIALNTISALAANNPYEGNNYYLLAAVDTTYPNHDAYYRSYHDYRQMQNNYLTGFVLMVLGILIAFITLIFLMAVSGHKHEHDKEITLHNFDKNSTETGILIFVLLTAFALLICRLSMVRVAHLVMSQDTWGLAERVLYTAMLYLGALLLFFSLLRRYKAGVLWRSSLCRKAKDGLSIFFRKQSFSASLTIEFFAFLILNAVLISLVWFLYRKTYLDPLVLKILIGVILLLWAALNLWVFYLTFRRAAARDKIYTAVERLAAGETSYQVDLNEFDGREWDLAVNINNISSGLESALLEKVKSERLKADLITNVSHDIKTPLTSIINYVDLIKREHIQNEKINDYLDILEQKSQRLKTLTEDLVEASKASSGNLKLDISDINFTELIYQTNGEFEEKFASRRLELVTNASDETMIIEADGRRLWRVLENLYNNAFKYAAEGSRVYIDIIRQESLVSGDGKLTPPQVVFTMKNFSARPLNIRPDELTERFVRGDVARTTEGSGLGLSIAKSLTELQNGRFEIIIDGDLFKILVSFAIKDTAAKELPADGL